MSGNMRGGAVWVVGAIMAVVSIGLAVPLVRAQQRGEPVFGAGTAGIDTALGGPEVEQESRLREGSVLTERLGTFQVAGTRIAFQPTDHDEALVVLENLALERVWKMLDHTRGRNWSVSGTVTEFRGRNFLLIERAVLRSRYEVAPGP